MGQAYQIIPNNTDISDIEFQTRVESGFILPIPSKDVEAFGYVKIRAFLHKYGLYTMPTVELIDYFTNIIKGRNAIEIGAGLGVIGRSLGIPTTDSKLLARPEIKAYYESIKQPTIQYPNDIEELDALAAVAKYKPNVVIGSFIMHLWDEKTHTGSDYGVDTLKLIQTVDEYYMIGSLDTHCNDPALKYLENTEQPDFLYTRAAKERSVIFHWKKH